MNMTQAKQLSVAVIGDEDLVSGLRLAGISKFYTIKGDHDASEDIREALKELLAEPGIGVIIILEDYAEYARGLLSSLRQEKSITPIIIDVPSKFGTQYKDIRGYYKKIIKESIGFDIEL